MAPVSADLGGDTFVVGLSQQARRRRKARAKLSCAKEASSASEKRDAVQTDFDRMMDDYKDSFPTNPDIPERRKSPRTNNDTLSEAASQSALDAPCEVPQSEESCKDVIETLERDRSEAVSQSTSDAPLEAPQSEEFCKNIIDKLEQCGELDHHTVLMWLRKHVRLLAIHRHGSRVVQKALEVATGSDRDAIIGELSDHVTELYESPHGNFVLSRAIECLPAAKFNFVISALSGKAYVVSKHKFGCRIVCRLIEHAGVEQINDFIKEIAVNIDSLARQAYGSFVVQSILEHGTPEWKTWVVSKLLAIFGSLCMDRSGSLLVQRLMYNWDNGTRNHAIERLNSQDLVKVACTRYGSFVVEQLASMQSNCPAVQESASILADGIQELLWSEYAQKVVAAFDLGSIEPEIA